MADIGAPSHYGDDRGSERPPRETRWSKAAVAGFGASFLGCTGIGGLLGLILGVVGIVKTSGGKRRGMGLAIAAIPTSLLTGAVGVYIGLALFAYHNMSEAANQVPTALNESDMGAAAVGIRKLMSSEFNDQVPVSELETWVAGVRNTHGKLVSMKLDQNNPGGSTPSGPVYLNYAGKFVSGDASVRVFFNAQSVLSDPSIVNIEIDGKAIRAIDEIE